MKTSAVILSAVMAAASFASVKADTLANWTFETAASTNNIISTGMTPGATQSGVGADIGLGTASASHAASATAWSAPAGNGSIHSWSANTWGIGDYFQFSVPLDQVNFAYSGITVSYDQNGSSSGPKTFYFAYSTDGSTFTTMGTDYGLTSGITWGSGTSGQGTQLSYDLSGISALNTASTLYFRVVENSPVTGGNINGGNVATAGTDRIDNFVVNATVNAAPEPATLALAAVGAGVLLAARRRKRQ